MASSSVNNILLPLNDPIYEVLIFQFTSITYDTANRMIWACVVLFLSIWEIKIGKLRWTRRSSACNSLCSQTMLQQSTRVHSEKILVLLFHNNNSLSYLVFNYNIIAKFRIRCTWTLFCIHLQNFVRWFLDGGTAAADVVVAPLLLLSYCITTTFGSSVSLRP